MGRERRPTTFSTTFVWNPPVPSTGSKRSRRLCLDKGRRCELRPLDSIPARASGFTKLHGRAPSYDCHPTEGSAYGQASYREWIWRTQLQEAEAQWPDPFNGQDVEKSSPVRGARYRNVFRGGKKSRSWHADNTTVNSNKQVSVD